MRLGLSIVLIAAVLLANVGLAGMAYASEVDAVEEGQIEETVDEAKEEPGEGSQQGDGYTEGDEEANSAQSDETVIENPVEEKQEGASGEGAASADGTSAAGVPEEKGILEGAGKKRESAKTVSAKASADEDDNDPEIQLYVSKVDAADGQELEGAHFILYDPDGNNIDEWTSAKTAHKVDIRFKKNKMYTLQETEAPEGYLMAAESVFWLDDEWNPKTSGAMTTDGEGNPVLLVEDRKTSIRISKVDAAGGDELEGATIQVLDSNGKVVEEWVSTKETHVIEGLKAGEEYTLKETVAPESYTVAPETTFTIDEYGNVDTKGPTTTDGEGNTVLLVEDALTHVEISKVDADSGEELEGARIRILDSEGHVIEGWDSSKEPHVIEGLRVGEAYRLVEEEAPDGYLVAQDISFSIDAKGKVETNGTMTSDGVLLFEDQITVVRVSKTDIADGAELEGAHIQIIDSEGNVVEEWDSTKEAHVIKGLKSVEEYTLKETVAPEGYRIASDTIFRIDEKGGLNTSGPKTTDGEGNTVLLVEDAKTQVKVSKVDAAGGDELEGATIQVLDSEGKVVEEWDSTKETHVIEGLKTLEEYTLKETAAPEGRVVQDADRLDTMGAVGIARTFAYGGEHGRPMQESIAHFHDKLLKLKDLMNTETGRKMAEERHAFLEEFLSKYRAETEGED